jgi:hypothetical protein
MQTLGERKERKVAMSRILPVSPSLEYLKNEAKALLKSQQARDPAVCPTLRRLKRFAQAADPDILAAEVSLAEVQYALAMEYGFESWARLKRHVESKGSRPQLRREQGKAWIEPLPELGWGGGKECTFCGALEAALAATDEPYSYDDLMGVSGLALRVRTRQDLCPSSAVGELPDEYGAIFRATGWGLPTDVQLGQEDWDRQAVVRKVVASIDAGLPVIAYNDFLDLAVVCGYEQGGQVFWWNEYFRRGAPHKVPGEKIGPLQTYIGRKQPALSPVEQLKQALHLAVLNWGRGVHDGGVPGRGYRYGETAYDLWIDVLRNLDKVEAKQLPGMMHGNCMILSWMIDARRAGARFLQERSELLEGKPCEELGRAARQCGALANQLEQARSEAKLFQHATPEAGPETWTPERRRREEDLLREAKQQDAAIIHGLGGVLAAMG